MLLSQVKPVQCSPTMVGFFSDKINILQHIKHYCTSTRDAKWNEYGGQPVLSARYFTFHILSN